MKKQRRILTKSEIRLLESLQKADSEELTAFARELCERILETLPDNGPTLIRFARYLMELAHYEEALKVLDHADVVVPEERLHLAIAQRGHCYDCMGDFDEAERLHLEAHRLDPDDATYLIHAASVAFRRGDLAGAEKHARRAITCTEGCIDEAYFNLGGYLLSQKKFVEAKECYIKALELDPNYEIAEKRLEDVERVLAFTDEHLC